jgi:hypothetical protein
MLKITINLFEVERTSRTIRFIRQHNRHTNKHIHYANIYKILKYVRGQIHNQRAQLYNISRRLFLLFHDRTVATKANNDNVLFIAHIARV